MRSAWVPEELRKRPFTMAQARGYGVTYEMLAGPQWRKVFRGVWAHVDLPDTLEFRLAAIRLVLPLGAFVCGLTAAWLWGIDVQDRRSDRVWIGTRTGRRLRSRPGCRPCEITVEDSDLQLLDGLLVTTPLRTVFDCARWLALTEGVVVADALAHAELVRKDELAAYRVRHPGLRWVRRLDRVIELMDARAESPMETRVRLLLVESGLPCPEPQITVKDERGPFVARGDMGYRDLMLMLEYDGSDHWAQLAADERRRERMRDLGWKVIVITKDDYYKTPEELVARVAEQLRRRRASHAKFRV